MHSWLQSFFGAFHVDGDGRCSVVGICIGGCAARRCQKSWRVDDECDHGEFARSMMHDMHGLWPWSRRWMPMRE
jgi:hypothetical protein